MTNAFSDVLLSLSNSKEHLKMAKKIFSSVAVILLAGSVWAQETKVDVAFTKHVEVFGIHIYATAASPDEKLLHAANVLAQ